MNCHAPLRQPFSSRWMNLHSEVDLAYPSRLRRRAYAESCSNLVVQVKAVPVEVTRRCKCECISRNHWGPSSQPDWGRGWMHHMKWSGGSFDAFLRLASALSHGWRSVSLSRCLIGKGHEIKIKGTLQNQKSTCI